MMSVGKIVQLNDKPAPARCKPKDLKGVHPMSDVVETQLIERVKQVTKTLNDTLSEAAKEGIEAEIGVVNTMKVGCCVDERRVTVRLKKVLG